MKCYSFVYHVMHRGIVVSTLIGALVCFHAVDQGFTHQ